MVGYWRGYLPGVRCRLAYSPADATATHCPCFSEIQIGFTFVVPAHRGSPGKRAVKYVRACPCVCVCVCVRACVRVRVSVSLCVCLGSYLLSGGYECVLVKWMTETTLKKPDTLPRLSAPIVHISCSPDNQLYAVSYIDNGYFMHCLYVAAKMLTDYLRNAVCCLRCHILQITGYFYVVFLLS